MALFGPTCPKCGKDDIKEVKPKHSLIKKVAKARFPILTLKKDDPNDKPKYVCQDCGYTWPKE